MMTPQGRFRSRTDTTRDAAHVALGAVRHIGRAFRPALSKEGRDEEARGCEGSEVGRVRGREGTSDGLLPELATEGDGVPPTPIPALPLWQCGRLPPPLDLSTLSVTRPLNLGSTATMVSRDGELLLHDQRGHHPEHAVVRLRVRENVAVKRPRARVVAVDDHIP